MPNPMKMDPSLVEELVSAHYEGLYRFALSLARNEAEAADLTIDEQEQEMIAAPDDVEVTALANADAELVFEALSLVTEIFRIPLALFYLEDLSYREIAAILEVPVGTVMSRLSRGKRELHTRLSAAMDRGELPLNVVPLKRGTAS
jgi:RNA polymerase sigma-70 factor (ECF subfamily)